MYVIFTVLGYVGALLTAIYTFRLIFRVLPGRPCEEAQELIDTGHVVPRRARSTRRPAKRRTPTSASPAPSTTSPSSPGRCGSRWACSPSCALFGGLVQVPGRRRRDRPSFLEPVFADSPLAEIHPSVGAEWVGLAIGGVDLARSASPSPTGSTSRARDAGAADPSACARCTPSSSTSGTSTRRSTSSSCARRWRSAASPTAPSSASSSTASSPAPRTIVGGSRPPRPRRAERLRAQLRAAADRRLRRPRPLLPAEQLMTNSLLWTPLVFGLLGLFLPKRADRLVGDAGRGGDAGLAIALLAGFDSGAAGLQDTVDVTWIPGLGVDYSLGIDGLNVFLILLTAVLWLAGTAFAAFREQERPHLFFLMMLLGETATLGAFLAQDLLLFVLFFDLMLVPFYFLFGAWGSDREGGPTRLGGDAEDDRLHADRLAADAGRGDRHRDHRRRRRPDHLLDRRPRPAPDRRGQPALDLLVLRRRLPGQDAGLPPARLDARRLPGGAAAGPGGLLRRAGQGRRLRLPARRAAALPRRDGRVPGGGPGDRPGLDPLRLGDGLHPDQRAAGRRLLLGRPARLHHRRHLRPAAPTGPTGRSCRWSTTGSSSRRCS